MHHHLTDLETFYLTTRADVAAGRIGPEEGLTAVANNIVTAADGRQWRVNPQSPADRAVFAVRHPDGTVTADADPTNYRPVTAALPTETGTERPKRSLTEAAHHPGPRKTLTAAKQTRPPSLRDTAATRTQHPTQPGAATAGTLQTWWDNQSRTVKAVLAAVTTIVIVLAAARITATNEPATPPTTPSTPTTHTTVTDPTTTALPAPIEPTTTRPDGIAPMPSSTPPTRATN